MRPSQKSNRNRGKNNNRGGGGGKSLGNVVNRVFESAGPEGKVRGTPQQIIDKYEQLARDSQTAGDRVTAENFLQHAEHYLRLLTAAQAEQQAHQQAQSAQQNQGGGDGRQNSDQARGGRDNRQDDDQPEWQDRGGRSGGMEMIEPQHQSPDAALVQTPEAGQAERAPEDEQPKEGRGRAPRRRRARKDKAQEGEGGASGEGQTVEAQNDVNSETVSG